MTTTFKRLRNIAVGTALVMSSAGAFAAAAPFSVNPNSNGLSTEGTTFTADAMTGVSSARISSTGVQNANGTYTYTGVGYINYSTFSFKGSPVTTDDTQLGSKKFGYGLYATFTQTFSCNNLLGPGTSCSVTAITLNLFADAGANNTYTEASLTTGGTVTANGEQILLGSVDTIMSGSAGIDAQGGAFQNVNTDFELTAAGSNFFVSPNPFYSFAFSAFNNTSQGLTCNTAGCVNSTIVVINQESGITDFNAVPEPMPLALMGLGMLGMVAFRRKQAKK